MRTIIHLSDLHFGRVDPPILVPLLRFIHAAKPDLVVVSGDLTQRAHTAEFLAARAFLDQVPFPWLVVPGNHDIPLYNLVARFARPLQKYRRYLCADLSPFFRDPEIAVAGLNTARSLTTKYGRLNPAQIARLRDRFRRIEDEITKVVVTHHPFDLPPGYADRRQLVGGAHAAMAAMAECGVDLLLSGHLHVTHTALTAGRYKLTGHSALVVQAGTATSTRGRGEANSFNCVRIEPGKISVEQILWNPGPQHLTLGDAAQFQRTAAGWQPSDPASHA
jgi:3',5'-cyclic AMP phosphodiesterase CpdA